MDLVNVLVGMKSSIAGSAVETQVREKLEKSCFLDILTGSDDESVDAVIGNRHMNRSLTLFHVI